MAAVALTHAPLAAASPVDEAVDRMQIVDLMNRYGAVHDFGTPDDYAGLFTDDAEISVGTGPALVKGRAALKASAERDHQRFGTKAPDGKQTSIMRHVISNTVVDRIDGDHASGSSYVMTIVKKDAIGPALLSVGRYLDDYAKVGGQWRIARRRIVLDFGNSELGKQLGF